MHVMTMRCCVDGLATWIVDGGIPDGEPNALTLTEICTELVRRQDSEPVPPEVVRAMLQTYPAPIGDTKWTATYQTAANGCLPMGEKLVG